MKTKTEAQRQQHYPVRNMLKAADFVYNDVHKLVFGQWFQLQHF